MSKRIGSCLSPRDNPLKDFRHELPERIPVHIVQNGPGEAPENVGE